MIDNLRAFLLCISLHTRMSIYQQDQMRNEVQRLFASRAWETLQNQQKLKLRCRHRNKLIWNDWHHNNRWNKREGCLTVHLHHEIKRNVNLMQQCSLLKFPSLDSGSQAHHPPTNSVQKTICCNSTSNAPDDGLMRSKHVELITHQ